MLLQVAAEGMQWEAGCLEMMTVREMIGTRTLENGALPMLKNTS